MQTLKRRLGGILQRMIIYKATLDRSEDARLGLNISSNPCKYYWNSMKIEATSTRTTLFNLTRTQFSRFTKNFFYSK